MMSKIVLELDKLPVDLKPHPIRRDTSQALYGYAVVFHEFLQTEYHTAGSQAAMLGMTGPVWVGWHAQCVLVYNYIENNVCQTCIIDQMLLHILKITKCCLLYI